MTLHKARPSGGGGSTSGCFLRCYDKLAVPDSFIRSAGLARGLRGAASAYSLILNPFMRGEAK